jgi:hypothetical protein
MIDWIQMGPQLAIRGRLVSLSSHHVEANLESCFYPTPADADPDNGCHPTLLVRGRLERRQAILASTPFTRPLLLPFCAPEAKLSAAAYQGSLILRIRTGGAASHRAWDIALQALTPAPTLVYLVHFTASSRQDVLGQHSRSNDLPTGPSRCHSLLVRTVNLGWC